MSLAIKVLVTVVFLFCAALSLTSWAADYPPYSRVNLWVNRYSDTEAQLQMGSATDANHRYWFHVTTGNNTPRLLADVTKIGKNGRDTGELSDGVFIPYLCGDDEDDDVLQDFFLVLSKSTSYGGVVYPQDCPYRRKLPGELVRRNGKFLEQKTVDDWTMFVSPQSIAVITSRTFIPVSFARFASDSHQLFYIHTIGNCTINAAGKPGITLGGDQTLWVVSASNQVINVKSNSSCRIELLGKYMNNPE